MYENGGVDIQMPKDKAVAELDTSNAGIASRFPNASLVPNPMTAGSSSLEPMMVASRGERASEFEELLALKRKKILAMVVNGDLKKDPAIHMLGVKSSRFYTLLREYRSSVDHTGLIRKKRGTKPGSTRISQDMLEIFESAYQEGYHGLRAGVASVLRVAVKLCLKKGIALPTRYAVSKFLRSKDPADMIFRKHGQEIAQQRLQQRGGFREIESPLSSIQMDHTQVDILLVDEIKRDVIVGRPWLTIIICTLTRVVLGYYLSLNYPNITTVQLAIISAVLPKNSKFNPLNCNGDVYPFYGLPDEIYTDNGADFVSPALILKCGRYGMTWNHRPIDKKWWGGIVERVIGTFMTKAVHFLLGTTGSNVLERKTFESEKNATMDFVQFKSWFANEITVYHGTKHAALQCSPRAAWEYHSLIGRINISSDASVKDEGAFVLDFMPSSYEHVIHPYGINFASRRYNDPILARYILRVTEIRYNPSDLSYVWALIDDKFYLIPCTRTRRTLSGDWESYQKTTWISRTHPVHKNLPNGTICDEYALEALIYQDQTIEKAMQKTLEYLESPANQSLKTKGSGAKYCGNELDDSVVENTVADAEDILDVEYSPVILIDHLE